MRRRRQVAAAATAHARPPAAPAPALSAAGSLQVDTEADDCNANPAQLGLAAGAVARRAAANRQQPRV